MAKLLSADMWMIRLCAKTDHSVKEIAEGSRLIRDRESGIVNRNTYA